MATTLKAPTLYSRIQAYGTLTESPRDVPDARFALPSTVHWMRALAILTIDQKLDFAAARGFYAKVQVRRVPEPSSTGSASSFSSFSIRSPLSRP